MMEESLKKIDELYNKYVIAQEELNEKIDKLDKKMDSVLVKKGGKIYV